MAGFSVTFSSPSYSLPVSVRVPKIAAQIKRLGAKIERTTTESGVYFDVGPADVSYWFGNLVVIFGSAAALTTFIKSITPIALKWIEAWWGRSVTIAFDGTEISITGPEAAEEALALLKKVREQELVAKKMKAAKISSTTGRPKSKKKTRPPGKRKK